MFTVELTQSSKISTMWFLHSICATQTAKSNSVQMTRLFPETSSKCRCSHSGFGSASSLLFNFLLNFKYDQLFSLPSVRPEREIYYHVTSYNLPVSYFFCFVGFFRPLFSDVELLKSFA